MKQPNTYMMEKDDPSQQKKIKKIGPITKAELLDGLKKLTKGEYGYDALDDVFITAESMLLRYINDPDIRRAWNKMANAVG